MRYRNLGPTPVSVLSLGALPFGSRVDEETSFALLDRFVERGGTFIDTANNYCVWIDGCDGGESERLLGRWLAARGNRDEVVLATKVGAHFGHERDVWPGQREGLARDVVLRGVRGSLGRLGTDRVDLLYGHVDDPHTPLAETVAAFGEVVAEGLAGQVGMSNIGVERFARARELARERGLPAFTALQQRWSYLTPLPGQGFGIQISLDEEMRAYLRTQPDVCTLGYSSLLTGAYTDPTRPLPWLYDHPGSPARLAALAEVAKETGATANQVVHAWMRAQDPVVLPIVGVSRLAQLDEALDAVDLELTEDQLRRLDEPVS